MGHLSGRPAHCLTWGSEADPWTDSSCLVFGAVADSGKQMNKSTVSLAVHCIFFYVKSEMVNQCVFRLKGFIIIMLTPKHI